MSKLFRTRVTIFPVTTFIRFHGYMKVYAIVRLVTRKESAMKREPQE